MQSTVRPSVSHVDPYGPPIAHRPTPNPTRLWWPSGAVCRSIGQRRTPGPHPGDCSPLNSISRLYLDCIGGKCNVVPQFRAPQTAGLRPSRPGAAMVALLTSIHPPLTSRIVLHPPTLTLTLTLKPDGKDESHTRNPLLNLSRAHHVQAQFR